MIIREIEQASGLITKGPLLGLDIGMKNIGVSISDPEINIASALKVIPTKELNKIQEIIDAYKITFIIAGWPIDMRGEEGESCQNVIKILQKIEKNISIPIILFDERFSTKIANYYLKENNIKRKQRDINDNSLAASIILNDFIDNLKKIYKS